MYRRAVLVSLALALWAVPAWAQPQIVETLTKQSTVADDSIGPMTIEAGNGYGLFAVQTTSGNRGFTSATSSVDGAVAARWAYPATELGLHVKLWTWFASSGGSVTITIDQNGSHINYDMILFEFSCPSGTCSFVTSSSDGISETTNTTHNTALSGELDLAANTMWVGACVADANLGTKTPTSGFETDNTNLKQTSFWQYEDDVSGGFTDERGVWTSGSSRPTMCRASGILLTASATGPPIGTLSLMGAGR